jgi:hypothetical protein
MTRKSEESSRSDRAWIPRGWATSRSLLRGWCCDCAEDLRVSNPLHVSD